MITLVQTIIAACAAIGAIAAAIVTWWVYRDSRKPDVVVYLERVGANGNIHLTLKNIGSGMAYDVEIDTSALPCCPTQFENYLHSFKRVSVLAPGDSRSVLAFIPGTGDKVPEGLFCVSVSYALRAGGKAIKRSFELEYESFASVLWTTSNETLQRKAIVGMEKSLKGLLELEKERERR